MIRAARVAWLALAVAAVAAGPATAAITVIDRFDDLSGWKPQPADGVELTLHPDSGLVGRSMRLDFRFVKGGGYAVVHKAVSLDLPENFRFRFALRGRCPSENLEFKLVDSTGENVWWSNQRDFRFPATWDSVSLPKRRISFAWGPMGGGEIRHVAVIEFAITAGSGGEGSVWLDQLTLEPLPAASTPPPKPVASATSDTRGRAAAAVDGDSATAWVSDASDRAPALTLDLGVSREFGGLTLDWGRGRAPGAYIVETSDDLVRWRVLRTVKRGGSPTSRDWLYLPESEARALRVRVTDDVPLDGVALAEVTIEPLAFGASLNDFYATIAKQARRGLYPRGISGEQVFWSVVGLDGDRDEGLLSEDGALEVAKGGFSIEPFLWLDGRLVTWADVTTTRALVDGDLPLPSVTWHARGLDLEIEAVFQQVGMLWARYRLRATGRGSRSGVLYLAMRPFQVDPPSQLLNQTGGVSRIESLHFSGWRARVGAIQVISRIAPGSSGAATFDEGDVVADWLEKGRIPPDSVVHDPVGLGSGVFAYPFDLARGDSVEVGVPIALHPNIGFVDTAPPALPSRAARAIPGARKQSDSFLGTYGGERLNAFQIFAAARNSWRPKVDRVSITLPGHDGQDVLETLRAQIGWILVNLDSAGIQPGSRSYERSWIRDGALTSSALLRLGHPWDVAAFIDWFASYQYADGKVPCCVDWRGSDPVPEHDSHGEFIYLVAEYLRYTGDRALAVEMWPRVEAAAAYLDTLRAQRLTPEWSGAGKEAFYGILPPSISHEGYSAKPMHSYWDDLWALRGYRDAAYLAGATGHPDAATHWQAAHDAFARDFAASVRAAMKTHAIPYVPGCADLGDFDATSTTIAFDPIQADTVLPAAAVDSTFERYWQSFRDRRDGRQAWDAFTPYEMRAIGAYVEMGWRERADSLLQWFMLERTPPEWRQWPEVVWHDARTPHFLGDLPHTWVGSDFARSVITMLAYSRERDSTLVIAAGVPLRWAHGAGVGVRGLPTPYGRLQYTLRAVPGHVEVNVAAGLRMPRGGIVVAPPGERRFAGVRVNGAPARLEAGGRVTVRKLPATVRFVY